jgi:hypothetical protein
MGLGPAILILIAAIIPHAEEPQKHTPACMEPAIFDNEKDPHRGKSSNSAKSSTQKESFFWE